MGCERPLTSRRGSALMLLCSLLLPLTSRCTERAPQAPQPTAITPDSGPAGHPLRVLIQGQRFSPALRANYDDERLATISTEFRATLGSTLLLEVSFRAPEELQALIPEDLPPGTFDLTVTDPWGRSGTLTRAFTAHGAPVDAGPDVSSLDLGPDAHPVADLASDRSSDVRTPDLLPFDQLVLPPDLAPGPQVSTVAGSGTGGFANGPALSAQFLNPTGVTLAGGALVVGDYGNHRIRSITLSSGVVQTLAGSGVQGFTDGNADAAQFNHPDGVTVDPGGAIYVADSANDRIRKIASGAVTTFAGTGAKGFAEGPAATVAQFNFPHGVAFMGSTLLVADSENHRIRAIDGGVVSTLAGSGAKGWQDGAALAAQFSSPTGLAVSGSKIYVADAGNHRIRLIEAGQVTTVAGSGTAGANDGPVAAARFWNPTGVVERGSLLFVVDQSNHRIRSVSVGQGVQTVSGSGFGYLDGPAAAALFRYPQGIAVGPAGELFIADQGNHRLRLLTLP